jgi:hypothetical protein
VPDQRNSFLYATIGKHTIPVLEGLGIECLLLNDGDGLESKLKDACGPANAQRAPNARFSSPGVFCMIRHECL